MTLHSVPSTGVRGTTPGEGTGAVRRLGRPLVEWLPVALVVCAEAAWLSALGGFVQAFAQRPPALGIGWLAVFVLAGLTAARLLGRRAGRWWPPLALGLIVLAGVAGVLVAPIARDSISEGMAVALATHPGGWVAGVAVLRGFAHARLPLAEETVARLVGLGVPGFALLAVVGGVALEPERSRFLADTLLAAIVFAGTGLLSLTLTRLSAVAHGSAWDWRRNPSWLAVTIGILAVAVVAAIPLAGIAGRVLEALVPIAVVASIPVGLAIGLDRTGRRVIAFSIGAAAVLILVLTTFGRPGDATPAPPAAPAVESHPTTADGLLAAGLGGLLLLAAAVAVVVLAALWMRRAEPPAEDAVEETRAIDRGTTAAVGRRRRRPWRRPEPTTAAEAYVAVLDDVSRHRDVSRRESETPAEHAARLRAGGRSELRLDLLAADYALVRYGGVDLPPREDRRAIARWRVLRRRLTRQPRPEAGRGQVKSGEQR